MLHNQSDHNLHSAAEENMFRGRKVLRIFDHIGNNVTRSKNNTPLLISGCAINTDKDNYPSD